jgi:hypothetical protein
MVGLLTLAVSCEKNPVIDPVDPADDGLYDLSQVSVVASGTIALEDFYNKLLQDARSTNDDFDQSLYDYYSGLLKQAQNPGTKADDSGSGSMAYGWTTLRYTTLSATGEEIECSELLVWPYNSSAEQRPRNVVIGCHLTILADEERPSNFSSLPFGSDVNMLACFANPMNYNALVVIPDYEGYGATRSRNHPYLNREVTARQVVDGARAGIAWFEKQQMKLVEGWKSVALGYSQGGAVAASVYRYCHEYSETGLRLAGAVCGDGPYDPMTTLDQYIDSGKLFMPVSAALLLKGAVDTDDNLKALGCKYEDFCTPEFVKTGVFQFLEEKNVRNKDIHNKFLEVSKSSDDGFKLYCWSEAWKAFVPYNAANAANSRLQLDLSCNNGMSYVPIGQCLKPSLVEYFKKGTIPSDVPFEKIEALRQCLVRNSIGMGGWLPPQSGGITFFHSMADEVVPSWNLYAVEDMWNEVRQNYSTYFYTQSETAFHKSTGVLFFVLYGGIYVDEILSGRWMSVHREL